MDQAPDDALAAVARAVDAVLAGRQAPDALEQPLNDLRRCVGEAAASEADDGWGTSQTLAEAVGDNIGDLRRISGWSQERLAEAMSQMGFHWNRQTAAESERGVRRRASLEEVLALAALFSVPALQILMPQPGHAIDLNEHLTEWDCVLVNELMLGRGGMVGEGGAAWRAPIRACQGVSPRPASDYARAVRQPARPS
jgi:transcriptional regulator with XRE-family HTH domain